MTNETTKTRNFEESLVAYVRALEIGKSKTRQGDSDLGSKAESFVEAGYRLESFFMQFNQFVKLRHGDGFTMEDIMDVYMDMFNEKLHDFHNSYKEIDSTPLKDDLQVYFPEELNYIHKRN